MNIFNKKQIRNYIQNQLNNLLPEQKTDNNKIQKINKIINYINENNDKFNNSNKLIKKLKLVKNRISGNES